MCIRQNTLILSRRGVEYLIQVDAYSPSPHLYGVRCDAISTSVFAGEFSYAPQLEFLQNALRDPIGKPTVLELSESVAESAGSTSYAPYGVMLGLRVGGFGASGESYELSK